LNYQAALFILSLFICLTSVGHTVLKRLRSLEEYFEQNYLFENILEQSAFVD